jgi:hypothetical protein
MAIIAAFAVLIASFAISLWSAWSARDRRVDEYLYAGNTELLGLSSCIGSVVSMAVSFTALLSAGYVWGWQILYSIIPGCLVGLVLLLRLSRHPAVADAQDEIAAGLQTAGASFLARFSAGTPRLFAFYPFFLAAYVAMLITELTVLRTFMHFLTGLPALELLLTVGVIAFVCFAYVFIGGFRAVLLTDYFQLLVVVAFVGVWAASLVGTTLVRLPAATVSRLDLSPFRITLLHLGTFMGALAWMFASADQWYRTFGTLPLRSARRVAVGAAVALSLLVIVPVIAGSSAVLRRDIPPAISNGISLHLVRELLRDSAPAVQFLFAMALVCAALTTLNTYIITFQQLYYEFAIRLNAQNFYSYAFIEYLAKWKQIRAVSMVALGVAFVGSQFLPERYVYAFGVLALASFIFAVPALVHELWAFDRNDQERPFPAHIALIVSMVLCVILLAGARWRLGSISANLYAIPASAAVASALGGAVALLMRRKAYSVASA